MEKEIKGHIKLLADKFKYRIEYEKEVMILKNNINEIRIWKEDKYGLNISINKEFNSFEEFKLPKEDFYDILIEILRRRNIDDDLLIANGILITIEEWIREEGKYAKERLDELKKDLETEKIEYRNLGGNRYVVEYFKGILILHDDLGWSKRNVISI